MKKIKYLVYIIIGMILIPNMVKATNLSLNSSTTSDNSSTYIINNEEEIAENGTIQLKVTKTNDDLTYKIESEYGECNQTTLSCSLIFANGVQASQTIATITITNNLTENKETTIKLPDDTGGSTKTFTVKATTVTTTKVVETPKSTDANLTDIKLTQGVFDKTFNSEELSYIITGIKDTINAVTITPTCNKCTYTLDCPNGECTITNNKRVNLQAGNNLVTITTKSEDESNTKTYSLEIYRGEVPISSAYLTSIKITDVKLSPTFNMLNNEYTGTFSKDLKKFDIKYETEDPQATVEIKGGDKVLLDEENEIIITVTSSDKENVQVYTLTLTNEVEETVPITTTKVEKKNNNKKLIIIFIIIGIIVIGGITYLFFRKKKNKKDKNNDKNNDKNDKGNNKKEEIINDNSIEDENTESLNILNKTKKEMNEEPKQDIDDALDDLMKTKKLELDDLDF